jgi:hypothetical protein
VKYWARPFRATLLVCIGLNSFGLNADPGSVDSIGGYTNNKTDEYHCHRDGWSDARVKVTQATADAEKEGRDLTKAFARVGKLLLNPGKGTAMRGLKYCSTFS